VIVKLYFCSEFITISIKYKDISNSIARPHKVLLIEDDIDIINLLEIHLLDLNCQLTKSYDGLDGVNKAKTQEYDLIILDIMLPKKNGMIVCQELRAENICTPIVLMSAKSEKYDKIMGMEYGADAYLTKPFRIQEFINLINLCLNHSSSSNCKNGKRVIEVGSLKLDVEKKEAILQNRKLDLSSKELEILHLLASAPGKSYSRNEIIKLVWGNKIRGYEHTVNSHINRLRSKIEPDIRKPLYILTSFGEGYRFNEQLALL